MVANLFDTYTIQDLTLRNRLVMSPMCMYSATRDGKATDWHFVHYPTRAVGGAGLIIIEATAVESRGRISEDDLGLYDDSQIEGLARIVELCKKNGAAVGVQLAHAGRKAWSDTKAFGPEQPVGPSALAFDADWQQPDELSPAEIEGITEKFVQATRRAREAGIDLIELHGAHGYLLSEFLSPLANKRDDAYGGDHIGRAKFPLEVVDAVRSEWKGKPLFIRLSCVDWAEGGNRIEDTVIFSTLMREHGVDLIDCSSGGVVSARPIVAPLYQASFAEKIKREAGIPTMAVGLITTPAEARSIVAEDKADLVALGRLLLREPYFPLRAQHALDGVFPWPKQYDRARG